MSLTEAIVLGLVQALTEFLPVSSSGHLRLGHELFDAGGEIDLFFDVLLHIGTLVAVFFIYRRELGGYIADAFRGLGKLRGGLRAAFEASEGLRFALLVVIATMPTAVIGYALKDPVESDVFSAAVVGGLLLVNGVILWLSKRFGDDEERTHADRPLSIAGIGPREALIIGIAQGCAVLPGISRAGITIVTALFLGAERMKAAELSFLLSIPAIMGAMLLQLVDGIEPMAATSVYAAGAVVSAIAGVAALLLLLRMLRAAQMHHFSWYCWALGSTAILLYVVRASG